MRYESYPGCEKKKVLYNCLNDYPMAIVAEIHGCV
jgi:hypothetical protein